MPNTSLNGLSDEIIAQIKLVAIEEFQDRIISVHDMDEVEKLVEQEGYPLVLIGYEGLEPQEGSNQGYSTRGTASSGSCDTLLANVRFSVIVAVEYQWNNLVDDTKRTALDLLPTIRRQLIGYMGVNNKPWRFVQEGPVSDNVDGIILYAQLWETTVVETTTRT